MAGCTTPTKMIGVRLRCDLRLVPIVTEFEVLACWWAEADEPFLDSLREPCDWDVSALSRAKLSDKGFLTEKL